MELAEILEKCQYLGGGVAFSLLGILVVHMWLTHCEERRKEERELDEARQEYLRAVADRDCDGIAMAARRLSELLGAISRHR